jgi:hypothetical protein
LSFSKLSRKQKIIFLAGVCEGEGSFGYWKEGKNRRRIRLVVTMSDEDIIMRFKDFFNCGSITKVGPRQEHYKQCWTWSVGGLDALIVLEQMLPLFGARRTSKYYSMIDAFRIRIKTGDHLVQKKSKKRN